MLFIRYNRHKIKGCDGDMVPDAGTENCRKVRGSTGMENQLAPELFAEKGHPAVGRTGYSAVIRGSIRADAPMGREGCVINTRQKEWYRGR